MSSFKKEPTLYNLLELEEKANAQEIKVAYKFFAKSFHPDKFPDNPINKAKATDKFEKVKEAYEILINSVTRKQYDDELEKLRKEESNINLCFICKENEATSICQSCGKNICQNCEMMFDGKSFCSICYTDEVQQICKVCNNFPSSSVCNTCGRDICNDCKKNFKGKYFCSDCLSKELEKYCEICQNSQISPSCASCGKGICENCESKIGNISYCPNCLIKKSNEKKKARKYLVIFSIILITLVVIIFSYWWDSLSLKLDDEIRISEKNGMKKNPFIPGKTEKDKFYKIMEDPNLDWYLLFVRKYPLSKRKNELIEKIKLSDPNLPPENYWRVIRKNNDGYWEFYYQKMIWLVWIPYRKFMIHSYNENIEQIKREIELKGYWIGKYEVSVKQYQIFCSKNKINFSGKNYSAKEPIRNINWHEAKKFCKWLGVRLPTELEWEVAARGNKNNINYLGGAEFHPTYYNLNSNDVKEIDKGKGNGFGLFNIIGNVEEWCQDWYSKDKFTPPSNNLYKVLRGGSFKDSPANARIIKRDYMFPKYKKETYGFRIAMD